MEHYKTERRISDREKLSVHGVDICKLIEKQGKRQLFEELADSMEYGTPYCVVIEKKILNDGLSSTLSLEWRNRKHEQKEKQNSRGKGNP